jgi:Ca2+-transporting ATPase
MRALIRRMAILAVALSLVLAIIYAALRGDVLQGLLAGITLAMAILPEELPVVLTVFLALGARRISKSRVLTRHMDAIETLGATTVLASDKTGTLTENRMAIRKVYADGETLRIDGTAALPEAFHALIEFGILASNRDPFDPMEQALHALGRQALYQTEHLHGEDGRWEVVHAYSLSPDLLAMSRVWRTGADPPGRIDYVVAAKGAPEAVADLCHLDSAQLLAVQRAAAEMAAEGLRVLGVARGTLRHAELLQGGDLAWPTHQHDIDFRFVGLVALEDPIRAGVADAVRTAQQAGIRVVMITGDHAHTAQAIARQLGLPAARVVTGEEIDAMTDAALSACVRDTSIYARSVPQQKLRLVRALQANGAIVAMTGDGVNDAPALKSAHIGVAMGKRGTDVAREAAALVLLDDDFSSIVTTLRHGRRVFDNLRKAVIYIVAVHVPIVGVSFVPVLLGQPLLLLPAHILFLELVIDPVCSIAFEAEPEEPDLMQRPPRDPATPMFGTGLLAFGLGQGLVALGAALAVYAWLLAHAAPPAVVRTAVFTTMALASLALVVNCRSLRRSARAPRGRGNRAFYGVAVAALGGLALVFGVPWLRELFRFTTPDFATLGVAVAAALATFGVNELLKRVQARLVRQTS